MHRKLETCAACDLGELAFLLWTEKPPRHDDREKENVLGFVDRVRSRVGEGRVGSSSLGQRKGLE